ncbi:MAG: hypothetical protein M3Z06_06375 [Actinomycetota bacterium]|nr:hypothetical protein [Actinomycetota bacterium]
MEPDDPLRRLEERLGRASDAAERLLAEAARSAAGRGEAPGETELSSLVAIVRSLRELIPADLERRLTEALRELLLAVRALIDWYLERIEQRRASPVPVQDIPIL